MSQNTQPLRPSALDGVSVSSVFSVPLKHGGRDFGVLRIAYEYDDDDIGIMRTLRDGTPVSCKLTATISCKTIVGGAWYPAEDVCRFAAQLLRLAYGVGKEKISIDRERVRVKYVERFCTRNVTVSAIYGLALDILIAYTLRFAGEAREIRRDDGRAPVSDFSPGIEAGAPVVDG